MLSREKMDQFIGELLGIYPDIPTDPRELRVTTLTSLGVSARSFINPLYNLLEVSDKHPDLMQQIQNSTDDVQNCVNMGRTGTYTGLVQINLLLIDCIKQILESHLSELEEGENLPF